VRLALYRVGLLRIHGVQASSKAAHPVGTGQARRGFRARSGEKDSSQWNFILIVPLDPTYEAGLAGHLPVSPFSL
jgi:hypothetical protein